MRLFMRFVGALLIVAATIGASTASAFAQDSVTLPTLAELRTVRMDEVITFNGEPGQACQLELASANRFHGTCHQFVNADYPEINIDFVEGRVIEFVYYDGKYYSRVDDETVWAVVDDEGYDPTVSLNMSLFSGYMAPSDTVITNVGRTNVNGTAATQYQFWSTNADRNAASGGQNVYDVFVSEQNYVLKDQESRRGTFPMGEGELAYIWSYSNFNGNITVAPPPAENVQAASVTTNTVRDLLPRLFATR